MNDIQVLGNEASAATLETRWLIYDPFPRARIFLTTYIDIYPKLNLRPQIKKRSKFKTF